MEHSGLSVESVQRHILATKGSDAVPLVRVAWNDPVLIKPVLDAGAGGVIAPMVRTGDEARRLVAACLYPPHGIRGFGPLRAANYGHIPAPEFCRAANQTVIPIAQIEHIDAVNNIDEILAVPGMAGIVFGPNDLACSMGHTGDPNHPEVLRAIDAVIGKARQTKVFIGCVGDDPELLERWIDQGARWLVVGSDFALLRKAAIQAIESIQTLRPKAAH